MRANVEILNWPERFDGYYYNMQLAVDGVPCVPFDVPASARELFLTEDAWLEYLTRQAVALIGMYGDARYPKPVSLYGDN